MFWFDLDNTPHVPLFRYFFQEFDSRGLDYFITARDFAQTKELLELFNIKYHLVGKHAGKNTINKIANLFIRAYHLSKSLNGKNIKLAISHGSRTQLLTARRRRIKSILMMDYEYTENNIFNLLSDYILIPKFIPDSRLIDAGIKLNKIIRYNGFKEEFYLSKFIPNNEFRASIGIGYNDVLTVVRPPSLESNYHNKRSDILLLKTLNHLMKFKDNRILIISRTVSDKDFILKNIKLGENIKFLDKTVDGLQLLYSADLVISGGGTMNREAALLGIKTYSIFAGRRPFLDEYLESIGQLKFINSEDDIKKILPERIKEKNILVHSNNLVKEVTDIFLEILKQ